MNIVVTGYVARFPIAAFFWHAVSFALGFRGLGHDVWFLEDSGDHPWGWDLVNDRPDEHGTAGAAFLAREMEAVGLGDRWVFRHAPTDRWFGMDAATTRDVLVSADVLVNVSCTMPLRREYLQVPNRLAVDTDPVFTQAKVSLGFEGLTAVPETHTRLFTYGRPPLLAAEHDWVPTRQPVPFDHWPALPPPPPDAPFTTLASWRAHPPVTWGGMHLGGKSLTFAQFADLPSRTDRRLAVGFGGRDDHVGHAYLARHGWHRVDARLPSLSTDAYRAFIADSAGEVSVAKHGYVVSRSGWFSERSCSYLAAGRPVIVQDTGFSDWLPTGAGLLAFSTPAEAAAAVETVSADPARHAAAARRVAAEHFDAAQVCSEMLEAAL